MVNAVLGGAWNLTAEPSLIWSSGVSRVTGTSAVFSPFGGGGQM
jgi:hypothetical protein